MSEICKSGRIVVDIDTIVILFMKARSVLTIEIKCLLLCGMFTLKIIIPLIFVSQPPTQLYCYGWCNDVLWYYSKIGTICPHGKY